jgi:recombination protein RecA
MSKGDSPIKKEIAKTYGDEVLTGFDELPFNEEFISTGIPSVDLATRGGMPVGRMVEFYGEEGSGKTGLSLRMCAQVQRSGGRALFVDMEYALNKDWAVKMGCLPDQGGFDVARPATGEEALGIVETAADSGAYDLIVVDSVATLTPGGEHDRDMGDLRVGMIAQLMSASLRRLGGYFYRNDVVAVFINQTRTGIGRGYSYKTTPGGKALRFHASMRVECSKDAHIDDGNPDNRIGYTLKTYVPKNKIGVPFGVALTPVHYESGVHLPTDIFNLATVYGIVEQSGSWFKFKMPGSDEEESWQGSRNAVEALSKSPQVLLNILEAIEEESGYPMLGGELVRTELGDSIGEEDDETQD